MLGSLRWRLHWRVSSLPAPRALDFASVHWLCLAPQQPFASSNAAFWRSGWRRSAMYLVLTMNFRSRRSSRWQQEFHACHPEMDFDASRLREDYAKTGPWTSARHRLLAELPQSPSLRLLRSWVEEHQAGCVSGCHRRHQRGLSLCWRGEMMRMWWLSLGVTALARPEWMCYRHQAALSLDPPAARRLRRAASLRQSSGTAPWGFVLADP